MRVWIDVMTPKQATMFGFIAKYLIERGHEVLFTAREYESTVGAARRLGIEVHVVGKYAEGEPVDKVVADAEREAGLARLVWDFRPDVLIAYPDPPAAKVAYGLSINYVALTDSPHAVIPSRLALPLARAIIFSACIPPDAVKKYLTDDVAIIQYNGFDELSWVLRVRPSESYVRDLGLEPGRYVIIRPHEFMATYYRGVRTSVDPWALARYVCREMKMDVVIIPRYTSHVRKANSLKEELGDCVHVLLGHYDGASLTGHAYAVITGGASMAREAALYGTPAAIYYPRRLYVDECIARHGFPLAWARSDGEVREFLMKAGDLRRDTSALLSGLDDPAEVVAEVLERVVG